MLPGMQFVEFDRDESVSMSCLGGYIERSYDIARRLP